MLLPAILVSLFVCGNASNITILAFWRDNKFQVLNHFWKNTGFSPLGDASTRRDYLLSADEKMNLAIIGSLPNSGITNVRIHWILDLVKARETATEGVVFDYQDLDELIDWLHHHGLVPTFELMGNPSGYFHNFRVQSDDWHRLIKEILSRYLDKYGGVYLYKWRFELLNEPDLKMYNSFNFTLAEYIDYFQATERALGRLLGPAGLFRDDRQHHPLCWGLLDHCNMNPCKLRMVTFHRKGDGVGSKIIRHGLDLIGTIQSTYGNLSGIAFGNDEADIMTGWHVPVEWRSDVRYASLVLQVIIGHINEMYVKRTIPFEILSNDNAFMNYYPNYFTQRTLLARFQMNNTQPPHVQFFRKPVYSVMGLLSLLGSYVTDIRYTPGETGLSYILTAEKYRTNLLGTVNDDRVKDEVYNLNGTTFDLKVRIKVDETCEPQIYAVYVMDNANSSPYQVWRNGGSPDFPEKDLRRKMRFSEGFKRLYYRLIGSQQQKVSIFLPKSLNPTIVSVNICNIKYRRPGKVTNLHYMKVNANEVLLLWSDELVNSKCLLTYVVEFRGVGDEKFKRVNEEDSIFLSYHFDGFVKGAEIGVLGEYRVAAVDYFNRCGGFSEPLNITAL